MPTIKTEQLRQLAQVPPGKYDLNRKRKWWQFWKPSERGGWITVSREENGDTGLMWTTDKHMHRHFTEWGHALALTLKQDGTLVAYFESAISMWIKWGYGREGEAELRDAIDFATWAHSRLCGQDCRVRSAYHSENGTRSVPYMSDA